VTSLNEASEAEIQKQILELLERHPTIAWAKRMNVGGVYKSGRWIDFGFAGCADIIGQLRDGRFFACEVKRPGQDPSDEQLAFLYQVATNNGLAVVASDVFELTEILNACTGAR